MALYEVRDSMRGITYVEAESLTELELLVEPSRDEFTEGVVADGEFSTKSIEEAWQSYAAACRIQSVELLADNVVRAAIVKLGAAR